MIEVEGLRKLYDSYLAVDGISFSIGAGQICGLIGPKGRERPPPCVVFQV